MSRQLLNVIECVFGFTVLSFVVVAASEFYGTNKIKQIINSKSYYQHFHLLMAMDINTSLRIPMCMMKRLDHYSALLEKNNTYPYKVNRLIPKHRVLRSIIVCK